MEILYIIGNGFDLWHGLPTNFEKFSIFARNELEDFEQYLRLNSDAESLWNDFEATLGHYDWQSFYGTNNFLDVQDEAFRPSMAFGLQDDLTEQTDNLVAEIKSQFQTWIESIELDDAVKKFDPVSQARFLSFNYTSVLQRIYGIHDDSIFHIHGNVSRYDDLTFGHGDSLEEEPELDENGDSNRTMFTDAENAAKYPFYAFQKPVNDIIDNNLDYFEGLRSIDIVVVIGHSLNDIDVPYFRKISEVLRDKKWIVSYYEHSEKTKHINQLEKCNIPLDNIKQYHIDEIPQILTTL